MTILGIDPGYDRVGWAVGVVKLAKLHIPGSGCIETNRQLDIEARYQQIYTHLQEILTRFKPDKLYIEELFFAKNTTTALKVAEARGVILTTCWKFGLEVKSVHPQQLKLAITGNGRATKQELKKMLQMITKQDFSGIKDDTLDALAIVIAAAQKQV